MIPFFFHHSNKRQIISSDVDTFAGNALNWKNTEKEW
jgi:hypothetical protein